MDVEYQHADGAYYASKFLGFDHQCDNYYGEKDELRLCHSSHDYASLVQ